METKFLISHQFRAIGAIFFILGILGTVLTVAEYEPAFLDVQVLMIFAEDEIFGKEPSRFVDIRKNNIFNELIGLFVIVGGLLLLLAKRKDEDEMMVKLRLESILWAAKINAILVIISVVFIYGLNFYYVMLFNLGILYALFALRFEWAVSKIKKGSDEK